MTSWTVALPGSSVYRISQTRMPEWFAISFSRGSFQPRDWTCVSCIGRQPYILDMFQFSSFQSLSHVRLFATPWTAACQASLSITDSRSLLKLMFIESVMPSNHIILCCPLLLPPSIFPSIRFFFFQMSQFFKSGGQRSFSFSISPSKEYSGLISFRMDWLDLLAVQGTLKSPPTPRLERHVYVQLKNYLESYLFLLAV